MAFGPFLPEFLEPQAHRPTVKVAQSRASDRERMGASRGT